MTVELEGGHGRAASSCGSSSRRASSRRSCAAAPSARRPTSRRGSAGSARSPTRRAPSTRSRASAASRCPEPIRAAAPPALLRRVDREPRAPRLHAPRARLPRLRRRGRARARRAGGGRARSRAQEDRQRADGAHRRPRDPPDQRPRRRLLPRAGAARAADARRAARAGARGGASRRCAGRPASTSPSATVECELVALAAARRVRDRARPDRLRPRARHRRAPTTTSTSRRSTSSARPRCTRGCASAAPTCAARSPATRSTTTGSRRSRARRAREAGLGSDLPRPVPQHHRPQRRARLRLRRGAAPDRRLRGARRAGGRRSSRVAGTGYGVSEAPRGLLYHRYRVDADGTILDAKIVPPTSQNQRAIEDDLRGVVERDTSSLDDERAARALRADDPQLRPVHLVRDALPHARGRTAMSAARRVVIGVGNRFRGDDGAGLAVAERLRDRVPDGVDVVAVRAGADAGCSTPGGRRRWSLVVDAVASGDAARQRSTASTRATTRSRRRSSGSSTHAFGARRDDRARARPRAAARHACSSTASKAPSSPPGDGLSRRVDGGGRAVRVDAMLDDLRAARRTDEQMHERALMHDVMRKIEEVAAAGGAARVDPRRRCASGALSHFTPEHFREHFADAARGTLAEGAEVVAHARRRHHRRRTPPASCSRASRSRSTSPRGDRLMCLGAIATLAEAWDEDGVRGRPAGRRLRRPALVRPRGGSRAPTAAPPRAFPVEVLDPEAARDALLRSAPQPSPSPARRQHDEQARHRRSRSRS